jgi:hypothetical protein
VTQWLMLFTYQLLDKLSKGKSMSKFLSILETIGRDFKKGLDAILPYAETAGEVAVNIFAPALGPLFNSTVTAVSLAEQKAAALGKQTGTGAQKLADVLQIMEPVIAQGLADAGKASDTAAVTNYINAIVTILNAAPSKTSA